tara:strand:- start:9 stop:617 length:609 start_codon:yes stop_codon:yes gene_type:complete
MAEVPKPKGNKAMMAAKAKALRTKTTRLPATKPKPKPKPKAEIEEEKPATKVKNADVYKKIETKTKFKPKFEKVNEDLKLEMKGSPYHMSDSSYDMDKAYDKNISGTARLHYLENSIHDKKGKYDNVPLKMEGSPLDKKLIGNQENLPEELKSKIEAAPQMKGSPYHMSNELKYGGPVIDQMQTLSQQSAMKVLKHSKGSKI